MKILGISSNYHDASAALVIDGEVIFAAAEERYTRHKHDPSFPLFSIDACLRAAKIQSSDLDLVAYHEDPPTKLSRTLASTLARWPRSLKNFLTNSKETVTSGFWLQNDIARELNIAQEKVLFAPHHMSHAAHAFLTSSYERAAVMTVDAVGEWTSSAIFKAYFENGRAVITPLDIAPFPNSLGLFFSAVTSFLGFKVNDGECSTMALAAFGTPRYLEQMRDVVRLSSDGRFALNMSYFDFGQDSDVPVSRKFKDVFGSARQPKSKLSFDSLEKLSITDGEQQRFADVAASAQAVLEEATVAFSRRALSLSGESHLCYAGGVALNSVANQKILAESGCTSLYIPPDPGDGGGAMGAALYVHNLAAGFRPSPRTHPYFGENYSSGNIESMVEHLEPKFWPGFSRIRIKPVRKQQLHGSRWPDPQKLVSEIAGQLQRGKIVGWFQGRFEAGPRALGARSILIAPDQIDLARKLSRQVKLRASFRPYALSLTEQAAAQLLDFQSSTVPTLARWMQLCVPIRKEYVDQVRAACHIDGTTRPQVVGLEDNPLFHELLKAFGELSGVEALLNTSFNESGLPLVASPYDALMMFARTDMDILVVEDFVLEKRF